MVTVVLRLEIQNTSVAYELQMLHLNITQILIWYLSKKTKQKGPLYPIELLHPRGKCVISGKIVVNRNHFIGNKKTHMHILLVAHFVNVSEYCIVPPFFFS